MSTDDFGELHVQGVSRSFGRRRALKSVTLTMSAGEVVGLLGPNGAGKSTLLAILATLSRPTSGAVRYGSLALPDDALMVRRRVGFLGHDLGLYPELSARENLRFFATLHGRPAASAIDRALVRARLVERADDPVGGFSRGMRQRLALERALLHAPRLVLLDEPFTGLDDASASLLLARLRELRADGAMLLVATHDLDLVDGALDRAFVLVDGRCGQIDPGAGLRAAYRSHLPTSASRDA